jgi:hypothetical protein
MDGLDVKAGLARAKGLRHAGLAPDRCLNEPAGTPPAGVKSANLANPVTLWYESRTEISPSLSHRQGLSCALP